MLLLEEAGYRNLQVFAHAHGKQGLINAVKAGMNSIEHGTCIDEECIDFMLSKGTYLVPTLIAMKINKERALDETSDIPDWSRDDSIRIEGIHEKNMKKAHKAGVKIVMGTDSGVVPHGRNLEELGYLCDIGMVPMEAIIAGTKSGAESLGWEDKIGYIRRRKTSILVISKKIP